MRLNWGWETTAFRAATAVAILHALDDAFLNRQPGVDLDQHALAAVISLAAGTGAVVAFPRLRPGFRAAISFMFGVLAIVNGALHVRHISLDGAAASDYTGVLALAAGVVLVLLGLAIPFLHRGEGARTRARRWVYRLVAVVAGALAVYVFLFPTSLAIIQTHKYREPIGSPPSAAYQTVSFTSSDGLELSGWYHPSRNRAAIIVIHGGGGDRTGAVRHAELLARHGFGALVYDSRGRGESEGSPVGFGWGWPKDVAGALAFLRERPDVDPERIGGLGLSRGADVLIQVAAEDRDLKAVVADGATGGSFADYRNLGEEAEGAPFYLTMYTAARVFSGSSPGEPLKELVARISPTPLLLISTGGSLPVERDFNRIYAKAAREPVELWDLPEVNHTAAIRERPEEYQRRVVRFFDNALLG
ncbi:MAG: Dipeptidylaminopeptidase/acylaminoacyl-peptidase -like protein [Gaiellaceae bacterium]|nr:Dipeptidylaminopeptidase/acylaminoacyl-peptidase -like protein [Gaiellaceae bacterium]